MSEPIVMTVLGPIPADELGRTLAHEHCLIDLSVWFSAPLMLMIGPISPATTTRCTVSLRLPSTLTSATSAKCPA